MDMLSVCPNCRDAVDEHPVRPTPSADPGSGSETERADAHLHLHLARCPLYRKHVLRAIAVTSAILYAREHDA